MNTSSTYIVFKKNSKNLQKPRRRRKCSNIYFKIEDKIDKPETRGKANVNTIV